MLCTKTKGGSNVKKSIIFIMLIIISSTYIPCSAQSISDNKSEAVISRNTQLLLDLGLLEAYSANASVTKDILFNTLDKMTGSQIAREHYFKAYKHDEILKSTDAIIVFIDMTGYSPYFALSNGTDEKFKYLTVAKQIGLLDGVAIKLDEPLNMSDYAKILYNALTIDLLKETTFGDSQRYEVQKGTNLLSEMMGIVYIEGVVNAAGNISLNTNELAGKKRIKIDNTIYDYQKMIDPDIYMGLKVRAYIDEDDMTEIAAIQILDDENDILQISSDDLVFNSSFTKSNIVYEDGDKIKNAELSNNVDLVYNGELIPYFDCNDFAKENGILKLIDNDKDGQYDVIMMEKYTSIVVQTVSETDTILTDSKQNTYDLKDFFEEGYSFIDDKGNTVSLTTVKKYNVISMRISNTGKITKMIQTINKFNGVLEEISSNLKDITVSGQVYECTSEYIDADNTFEKDKVNIGDEVTLFLDFKGMVVDIKLYRNERQLGYLIDFSSSGNNLKDPEIKILNTSGKIEIYSVASNVKFNGQKRKSTDVFSRDADNGFWSNGSKVPQLVGYKITDDGVIYYIETAEDRHQFCGTGYSRLTMNYTTKKGEKMKLMNATDGKLLGSKYILTQKVKLFKIPIDGDEKQYEVLEGTSLNTDNDYMLYNVNDNYEPEAIVMISSRKSFIDANEQSFVVDRVVHIVKDNGDEAYRLYAYNGVNLQTFLVADGKVTPGYYNAWANQERDRYDNVQLKDVPRGSIIQVVYDDEGVYYYSLQQMPQKDNSEVLFENGDTSGNDDYGISEYMYWGKGLFSFGKVIGKTPYGIIVNNHSKDATKDNTWNRHFSLPDKMRILFYDKKNDRLKIGSLADILVGDMIAVHRTDTTTKTLKIQLVFL